MRALITFGIILQLSSKVELRGNKKSQIIVALPKSQGRDALLHSPSVLRKCLFRNPANFPIFQFPNLPTYQFADLPIRPIANLPNCQITNYLVDNSQHSF